MGPAQIRLPSEWLHELIIVQLEWLPSSYCLSSRRQAPTIWAPCVINRQLGSDTLPLGNLLSNSSRWSSHRFRGRGITLTKKRTNYASPRVMYSSCRGGGGGTTQCGG